MRDICKTSAVQGQKESRAAQNRGQCRVAGSAGGTDIAKDSEVKFILHIIREPESIVCRNGQQVLSCPGKLLRVAFIKRAQSIWLRLNLKHKHSPVSIVTGKLSNFVNSHSIATVNLQGRFAHSAGQRRVAVVVMNAQAGQRCRPGCVVAEKAKQRKRERGGESGEGAVGMCLIAGQ